MENKAGSDLYYIPLKIFTDIKGPMCRSHWVGGLNLITWSQEAIKFKPNFA